MSNLVDEKSGVAVNWRNSAKLDPITYAQTIKTHFFSVIAFISPVPVQVIYCGKDCQNYASNVILYPCERPRQHHLKEILREFGKFLFNLFASI